MQFNDTTNKSGLIQDCEFWTRMPDAKISGTTLLLQQFTRLINVRYSRVLAKIQLLSGKDGAEDTNYSKQQFSTFTVNINQNDYQFLTDADGNTIADITGVAIIPSGSNDFSALDRLSLSDNNALLIMSPNASNTGTPTGFIEKNNTVFLDVLPSFSTTGKLFYRLVPSYFTTADTAKTPGFVEGFHRLLSIGASYDWLRVNKTSDTALLASLAADLKTMEDELETYIRQKNPTSAALTARQHSSR